MKLLKRTKEELYSWMIENNVIAEFDWKAPVHEVLEGIDDLLGPLGYEIIMHDEDGDDSYTVSIAEIDEDEEE